jgi:hypothetical protein
MSGEGTNGQGGGTAAQTFGGGGAPPPGGGEPAAGGPGPHQSGQAPEWASGFEPEVRDWVASKGVKDPGALAKGYHNLEKVFGAEKAGRAVVKPADWNDPTQRDQFYRALGRPDTPDAYGLQPPEGDDGKLTQFIARVAHANGLLPDQAKALHDAIHQAAVEDTQAGLDAHAAANQRDFDTLKAEWTGNGQWDANVALGKRANSALGLDGDTLDKIETAIGSAGVFKLFAKIGAFLREDPGLGPTAGAAGNPTATPQAAKAELDRRAADPEFRARLDSKDPTVAQAAALEQQRLFKAAYPG